jgi:hypothetical protein
VRLALARGAFNLIVDYGNAGQIAEARALFDLLRQLGAEHPEEAEVRLRVAQGTFNLITAYGSRADRRGAGSGDRAKDALMSTQFAASLRDQLGEEAAAQMLERLRSWVDS